MSGGRVCVQQETPTKREGYCCIQECHHVYNYIQESTGLLSGNICLRNYLYSVLNNSCLSPLNYQLDNETGTVYQLHCWDMYWIETLHLVNADLRPKAYSFQSPRHIQDEDAAGYSGLGRRDLQFLIMPL